jgi:hypothetical protein
MSLLCEKNVIVLYRPTVFRLFQTHQIQIKYMCFQSDGSIKSRQNFILKVSQKKVLI